MVKVIGAFDIVKNKQSGVNGGHWMMCNSQRNTMSVGRLTRINTIHCCH